jgi:hypothetical protein
MTKTVKGAVFDEVFGGLDVDPWCLFLLSADNLQFLGKLTGKHDHWLTILLCCLIPRDVWTHDQGFSKPWWHARVPQIKRVQLAHWLHQPFWHPGDQVECFPGRPPLASPETHVDRISRFGADLPDPMFCQTPSPSLLG